MADTPWTKGPWEIIDGSVLVPRGGSTSRPVGIRGLTVSHYSGPRGNDEESANARLIAAAPDMEEALAALLRRDEINTCQHEETHRVGFLWEICDQCGAKWADDEGGKPEWVDPPEWKAARDALAKARGEQ